MSWADLAADVRHAARIYRRNPRFVAAALTALALGIGGCSVIFGIADVILLRPLAYPGADALVLVSEQNPEKGVPHMSSSPARFLDYRREVRAFSAVAAYRQESMTLLDGGDPERLEAVKASPELFELLGVQATLGRSLAGLRGETSVAVLGHDLWRRRFGGDPEILGRTLRLGGALFTVAGVMPPGFRFPADAELWVPLDFGPEVWADREGHYLSVIARLAPGVGVAAAQAEMDTLSRRLAGQFPADAGWISVLVPFGERLTEPLRPAVLVLAVAGALLLVVACGNVANLLLARAASRGREVAIRAALGAGAGRLARQMLTESVLLTLAGGALGVALAALATRAIVRLTPQLAPRWPDLGVDGRMVLVALGLSVLSGLAAGLPPAWRASRSDLRAGVHESGPGTSVGWRRNRAATLLAVLQIALSLLLLVGAGLLLRSFGKLLDVDPGFDPRGVLTLRIELPRTQYPEPAQRTAFFARALERVRALPEVESAGATSSLPLAGSNNFVGFKIPGRPAGDRDYLPFYAVTPGYFEALRIPVVSGRVYTETDRGAEPGGSVLSAGVARRLFTGEDPIGRELLLGSPEEYETTRILGVVGDVRAAGLAFDAVPAVYSPHEQAPSEAMTLVVRTRSDPVSLAAPIRRIVAEIDPRQPVDRVATLDEVVRASVADRRLALGAMAAFAALALVLALVGVYGVLSNAVSRSTREIGVRMALGARPADILRLVIGYAGQVVAIGLVTGLGATWAASRLLASQLFGIAPSDALTYAGAAALLALLALAAALIPARRALRTDPAVTLRQE